ncbi:hypothetical protein RDI58_016110 [Solanum bulbocastanum]|uniref:Uncharacterized protein n=1 Tax=Solanum bulbocastanum TaxID=147425 RepID=A0AAN8YC32_SOLBU
MSSNLEHINTPNLNFTCPQVKLIFSNSTRMSHTVLQSNSIMNAHNKTKLTHARINCALKGSNCDSPLSKIFKFTILASNASSISTKVLKYPHNKDDSIFTQFFNNLYLRNRTQLSHSQR